VSRLKPAYSAASDTFNQGFMVHLARRVCASSQLLPNVHKVARREQWREMRADVAGIEDRDAERRGRRTTRGHASRSKWVTLAALFSRMARRYSHASVVHRSRMP
jgi:hypothetical protein